MATVSFSKQFVINNPTIANKVLRAFENPKSIAVRPVNLDSENKKGIELLRKSLRQSNSKK